MNRRGHVFMNIIISELIWPNGIEALQEKNWNVVYDPELWKDPIRLSGLAKSADALIIRNQTQITRELLSHCSNLKVLGRLGVGMDNIDLQAAAEAKVVVVYGKNSNATSVAEYVISSLFACTRQLREASTDVKEGNWNRRRFTGNEISGKTLGLIGVGEISV
jgi:D-3-phosphoglycerate dehydrogenase/(S)-sulfolactate dehydrogenase